MQRSQAGIFGFGGTKARVDDAERPKVTFADVAGEDEAKKELAEIVDFLKNPTSIAGSARACPAACCSSGRPAPARRCWRGPSPARPRVPFFSISASEFVELFVGVGASRVRDLFTKAKAAAPAIVFVDEIDAVGRQRGAGLGGGNDEREQTLNQLLVEMDGFDDQTQRHRPRRDEPAGRPRSGPAATRPVRPPGHGRLPGPRRAARRSCGSTTAKIPLAPTWTWPRSPSPRPGFSGADLANLANEAALRAARKKPRRVTQADFEEALDSIMLGTRQPGLTNVEERRRRLPRGRPRDRGATTPGADPVSG